MIPTPLVHTIALEPARWTPARTSQPLPVLIEAIAAAGFSAVEIFEPHLDALKDDDAAVALLQTNRVQPVILSSYLDVAHPNAEQTAQNAADVIARMRKFGFQALRIFPGRHVNPNDTHTTARVASRLRSLARALSPATILLETHDGSIADDPARIVRLLSEIAEPNVGLLFQPTVFTPEATTRQLALQRDFILHVHLQNRNAKGEFATLAQGVIPWPEILRSLPDSVGTTIEFTPAGLRPDFSLPETLAEISAEIRWLEHARGKAADS
jgi:sugar phosphate isomerase/epimerase